MTPAWVADPELGRTWERVRARFERAGLQAQGYVVLSPATRGERQAVAALLGRPAVRARVRVDLAGLDARLRERSGIGGLAEVLPAVTGQPLLDRPAARAQQLAAREAPLALAGELVTQPWADRWVAGLRSTGVLTGRDDAEDIVRAAAAVMAELAQETTDPPGQHRHTLSRVELAARLLGDAHALDRGTVLHHVVVRALAAARDTAVPTAAREVEELWAGAGVAPDLLSRTCLVWGLRLVDGGPLGARLAAAARAGDPVHLTEWELRRTGTLVPEPGILVLVCENPRVLEAVAQDGIPGWAVVCTSGEPNLVVDRLLVDLAAAGVELRYHGDLDWPGVAIANRAMMRYRARPWLMSAQDYLAGVSRSASGPALSGGEVEPGWDPDLGAAMRSHGRGVHEEAVLDTLLQAVRDDSP
ncbi:TIGR02679 family protein [Serinicoccus sp. CUA-874]|uniref:TIGR02679 family protein n=1 Tax=Serinicoccus sp. CUA-874 TaxID=1517939 RepID=UPI0013015744|nr:TIGR02679 family protein [Serinicoccus sp. CUA-874]